MAVAARALLLAAVAAFAVAAPPSTLYEFTDMVDIDGNTVDLAQYKVSLSRSQTDTQRESVCDRESVCVRGECFLFPCAFFLFLFLSSSLFSSIFYLSL
jgi:hypothetical protein